jgi:hypothetical protein
MECDDNVNAKVKAWQALDTCNCHPSDPRYNLKNDVVMNNMLVSAKLSLFLKANYTGNHGHSAVFIASDMSREIWINNW